MERLSNAGQRLGNATAANRRKMTIPQPAAFPRDFQRRTETDATIRKPRASLVMKGSGVGVPASALKNRL
jgi:hypothetical protein